MSQEEQEVENQTKRNSAIAFVKTRLSLIHLLFTYREEDSREENRNLQMKLHVKQKDKHKTKGAFTVATARENTVV